MAFQLREYQQHAVEKILWSMSLPGNDIVVLPTGSGKSLVIAEVAVRLNQEILILQPSKEILEQNVEKMRHFVPANEIGVFSASCNSKRTSKYTFATIGSIHTKIERFKHIKLVLIDEAHLVNQKRGKSMYNSFLKKIGNPKVVGFTATPYRLVRMSHPINKSKTRFVTAVTLKLVTRTAPLFWNRLLVNISIGDLIEQGYLSPLKYEHVDLMSHAQMKLNAAESDFDLHDFEVKLGNREAQILSKIKECTERFKSVLVFCSSVRQAEKFSSVMEGGYHVSAKTNPDRRDGIIHHFKEGNIRLVFNVGVLTTGFDHPALDCIVLIRPTRSLPLLCQMVGRGVRIAEGKEYCTVVDFSGSVLELGRIESVRLEKVDEETQSGEVKQLWQILTDTGRWHNRMLYSYIVEKKSGTNGATRASDISHVNTNTPTLF